MRTVDEIEADARPGSPFSNSTMGEAWMENWCYRCKNDVEQNCPLVLIALMGKTPVEWFEQEGAQEYHCVEFRDVDDGDGGEPLEIPDPPGMEPLFSRESVQGVFLPAGLTRDAVGGRVSV